MRLILLVRRYFVTTVKKLIQFIHFNFVKMQFKLYIKERREKRDLVKISSCRKCGAYRSTLSPPVAKDTVN